MKPFILSIDAGTTGITVVLIDKAGKVIKKYYQEFTQLYPKPGWVEHDADEIWDTTLHLLMLAFKENSPSDCKGIGITNQRETTVIWNRETSKPIHNAIVWQCRRTSSICTQLSEEGLDQIFKEKTGLLLDSYFSGTKIKWLLDNVKGARKNAESGKLAFGTIDTWLVWKLTEEIAHVTDYTNASRTLLFNINSLQWDEALLDYLHIPHNLLPQVLPSAGEFGRTRLFGTLIPICGIAGDQQAALFGQGCFDPGETKCTYGTGCFMLTNTGKDAIQSTAGLLTTIAIDNFGKPAYALEGSVFIGGALIQWLRDELQLINHASDSEEMAQSVSNSNGVVIVPAFTGLGAPYWDMNARGTISGLTRGVNKNHIIRAALESIAFQVRDLLESVFKDLDVELSALKVDGGAVTNNFLMQFQSDILNLHIVRPENIESTALGAAFLAGLQSGFWENSDELKSLLQTDREFSSQMDEDSRSKLVHAWQAAVRRTLSNSNSPR
ncbi:MAG: glycerol kinase GlpK [Candidatus Marinimicrobia bacterium]|nr:glycerol kinase GlpK [Candidatus Neomarinimicrobiota bacterium]